MADCQDDCQRRRPPVKPQQPGQVDQGTNLTRSSLSCTVMCGMSTVLLKKKVFSFVSLQL